MRRRLMTIGVLCVCSNWAAMAQQSIGTVGVSDATVSGALEVTNGRALLRGASTVTAKDKTAEIALDRGGTVKVCATSGLHVTAGKGAADTPLLLALDRGAVEVATLATTSDVVMTPDLRFTLKSPGVLDLRMRVARNGDTCVENRGAAAPVLSVADQFGEASYELHADQHVLFEHGSLKEVVDHESEPCGCPAEPVMSVVDAGVTGANVARPGSEVAKSAAGSAAEQHPFPAAVSAGLSPASALPATPQGQVHAQVSTTMSYSTTAGGSASGSDGAPPTAAAGTKAPAASSGSSTSTASSGSTTSAPETADRAEAPPPPPAPSAGNVFHSIGHFFKRLFGGH